MTRLKAIHVEEAKVRVPYGTNKLNREGDHTRNQGMGWREACPFTRRMPILSWIAWLAWKSALALLWRRTWKGTRVLKASISLWILVKMFLSFMSSGIVFFLTRFITTFKSPKIEIVSSPCCWARCSPRRSAYASAWLLVIVTRFHEKVSLIVPLGEKITPSVPATLDEKPTLTLLK